MYISRCGDYGFDMMTDVQIRPKAYSYLRMSTERQLLGDSKRRQEELSRRYAEEHGLQLVDDVELQDIGVSAFKGHNVQKGALGGFIEQVEAGKIEAGSYLLVESFDRLSRQEIRASLGLFMRLTDAGINIVTLSDRQIYMAGETDMMQLMYSIMVMSRAHEESKTKSNRISEAWANKRKNIGEKKLTARAVGWVKLAEDRRKFDLIPDRVKIVRRIFEETADGIGAWSIVRRLNDEGIKPFGRASGWQKSSVDKIILSKAVIGEFQPRRRGEIAGEAIRDYYPAAIDEALFYRAEVARKARSERKGGGRRGARISNLFSRLAVCGYCGGRMHYLNKGGGPKGGEYLVCDAANRKTECTVTLWRYRDFETSFLTFVEEVDLEAFANDGAGAARRTALEGQIQALHGRQRELMAQRDRAFDLGVGSASGNEFIGSRIDSLSAEIDKAAAEIVRMTNERDLLQSEAGRFYEGRDEVKLLIARLQSNAGEGIYELRARVAAHLLSIVTSLQVFPAGEVPTLKGILENFGTSMKSLDMDDVTQTFVEELNNPAKHEPYFLIMTKDGRLRRVTPSPDDPAIVREQLIRDSSGTRIIRGGSEVVYDRSRPKAERLLTEFYDTLGRDDDQVAGE